MPIHDERALALPERPRLLLGLPVLWRSPATAQLGVNPQHAVLLEGLSPSLASVLRELDGSRTLSELLAGAASEAEERDLRTLLENLCLAGVVEDRPETEDDPIDAGRLGPEATTWALRTGRAGTEAITERQHCAVIVHGSGRLAVNVASLLAASGVGWVHVRATGVVRAEETGNGYLDSDVGRDRASAAREAVLRSAPEALADPLPRRRLPDLVILADAEVPEPDLVADLMARGTPHLVVKYREGIGVVGPLVVPGRSSCLRCCDLHRTDLEPLWPTLAAQLAGRPQQAEIAGAGAAAALATGQALAALGQPEFAEQPPACWNATLELDTMLGTLDRRPWWPHAQCGCGSARLPHNEVAFHHSAHPRPPDHHLQVTRKPLTCDSDSPL